MKYPMLEESVCEVEQSLPDVIVVGDVAEWFAVQQIIDAAVARLKVASGLIGGMCAESVPREKGATIVSEGKTFKRTGTPSRTGWGEHRADLIRVVLDSRVFDSVTGELIEETPADKILAVWTVGAPKVTELKRRGIDPEEFCTTTWANVGVAEVTV